MGIGFFADGAEYKLIEVIREKTVDLGVAESTVEIKAPIGDRARGSGFFGDVFEKVFFVALNGFDDRIEIFDDGFAALDHRVGSGDFEAAGFGAFFGQALVQLLQHFVVGGQGSHKHRGTIYVSCFK